MEIVVVEDDPGVAREIVADVRRWRDDTDVRVITSEYDFRQKLSAWIIRPPNLFVIDVLLRWASPARSIPERPPEATDNYRAGLRCIQLLQQEPKIRDVPIVVHTVLDRADLTDDYRFRANVAYLRKGGPLIDLIRSLLRAEEFEGEPYRVFLVHGHDIAWRESMARFLESLGMRVVILGEQVGSGNTIIEALEANSKVDYAIVLLTADDLGRSLQERKLSPRARQNVILELGYFVAKLGRSKVCCLYEVGVEIPTDYQAVLYIGLDAPGAWKTRLARELLAAGAEFSPDVVLRSP